MKVSEANQISVSITKPCKPFGFTNIFRASMFPKSRWFCLKVGNYEEEAHIFLDEWEQAKKEIDAMIGESKSPKYNPPPPPPLSQTKPL